MGVLQRDPEETASTLTEWLRQRPGVESPAVDHVVVPESTGWSNETVMVDARWSAAGEDHRAELVARIAPSEYQVFPDETFLRQYTVMRALADRSDVPMPEVHWYEPDPSWFGRPFWIMDRVHGDIPSDAPPYAGGGWLFDASPDQQAQAWTSGIDAMARVHRTTLDRLDMPPDTYPTTSDTVGWHLDHIERFLTWAEDGRPHPLARRALEAVRRDRPPEPPEGPCLVWGDSRLSNLVYREFDVVAVLDWEMSSIGDPLLDLGWWVFADWALTKGSGCQRLPGFPSTEETVRTWSGITGRSADAFDYYELYAGLRFTVIMLRMGRLLAEIGLVPPEFARDNLISDALAELLDRHD